MDMDRAQTNRASQASDVVTTWMGAATTVLDVRPELAAGGEPFVRIMEAAAQIPVGGSLVLVAPFEPVPLYGALQSRGFTHTTHQVAADEWVVRFTTAE